MTALISGTSPEARTTRNADSNAVCGRELEQGIVHGLLRRAQQGTGGVVLVGSQPGARTTYAVLFAEAGMVPCGVEAAPGETGWLLKETFSQKAS